MRNATVRQLHTKQNEIMNRIGETADQAKTYLAAGQRQTKKFIDQVEANTKKYPFRALAVAALAGYLYSKVRRFI